MTFNGKPYTKKDIMEIAAAGKFINTDGIVYDLDGKAMAEFLRSLGFKVASYKDIGTNGLVTTWEGVNVSTNGYCSMRKRAVVNTRCAMCEDELKPGYYVFKTDANGKRFIICPKCDFEYFPEEYRVEEEF